MKSGILCGAFLAGVNSSPVDEIRRYSQWKAVMQVYNPDFDEKKFWTYGCNCLALGDRPLSGKGYGQPVDKLDHTCMLYKQCLKCAKEEYGERCTAENVNYKFDDSNGQVTCKHNPDKNDDSACKRKICECDKMFAEAHSALTYTYDQQYHSFWGNPPFKPEEQCQTSGGPARECCGSKTSYSQLFSPDRQQCCPGTEKPEIRPIGEC